MKITNSSKISFAICFTIALLIVVNYDRSDPFYDSIKSKILDITEPILTSASSGIYAFSEFTDNISNLFTIRKDNAKLKERNKLLEHYFYLYKQIKGENQELKRQLNYTQELKYNYVTGQIISRTNNYLNRELIVNIGEDQGIKKRQMVLAKNTFIGRVIKTSNNTSNILLITDNESKIPAIGVNSRIKFIASGLDNGNLSCDYLHSNQLEEELVITSGDSELILPNIIIGNVFQKDNSFYIKPIVNFDEIEFVQILQP
ncbi:MAG: rod shape-determining protein MreC [Rickettsiales bacterium]|jgi:rod shape-determining protein MreC|nr:rod shape-determining protein MreC [Rickettsiales bacterium]